MYVMIGVKIVIEDNLLHAVTPHFNSPKAVIIMKSRTSLKKSGSSFMF